MLQNQLVQKIIKQLDVSYLTEAPNLTSQLRLAGIDLAKK